MLVLMHSPSDELFPGVLHPAAALFEDYFDIDRAVEEHENYQRELSRTGAEVLTVKEVLLQGTLDKFDNPIEGEALDNLRTFASDFLTYNTTAVPERCSEQADYKRALIARANPRDLVRIILLQPEIVLRPTDGNTGLTATYIQRPAMNAFFMRDQIIATPRGVVIGRMHSPQRQDECRIVEFCLDKLGIHPLGRIEGDGYLEGGDWLPFGDTAFIGCGLRTNQAAIDTLMRSDWLGVRTLVVVNDRQLDQRQMHLDTYFNIIDTDLVTLSQERLEAVPGDPKYLTVDVWMREDGEYRKVMAGKPLVEYLTVNMGATIVPVSRCDEDTYACNYLTLAPRRIMAVAGQSDEYREAMNRNNVNVTWVEMSNLIKGYGAAHCMTQVIERN